MTQNIHRPKKSHFLSAYTLLQNALLVTLITVFVAGCSSFKLEKGPKGLFGGGDAQISNSETELGVNGFIWQATLDALSFMPMTSADPIGGIVITDWYQSRSAPKERFKVTVYILDKNLRADGLRVSAFKQERTSNGWQDATLSPEIAIKLENAILSRARELHILTLEAGN
ncbi:hypothetical protein IMCC14465_08730 [alpha proteobacterium IMCC14465]|uniref:DUF3576 domain-containing protein n=1 Tax=alpha proteobacterium IMCC14465 TaxID=1220535 RepID=J9DVR0_9PROT|nr:hypothetical protein IMCC14465_08730 [alpha proteobacterium IMCC14465]